MKACSTTVARALGYIKTQPKIDENVHVLGPMVGKMRSWHSPIGPDGTYHHEGLSNKELWLRRKAHAECVKREFSL